MFFKKKTETKGAVANGAAKAAPTAGPQPAVEIPPAAPAPKVEPVAASAPAPAAVSSPPVPTPVEQPIPAAVSSPPSILPTNVVLNGDFLRWSNGDRLDGIKPYQVVADDWIVGFGNNGVRSVSVYRGQAPTNQPGNSLVVEVTEAGTPDGWFALHHRIPNVRTLAGQKVTLSFWAKSTAAEPLGIALIQFFGAEKEKIARWAKTAPLSPDWQKHEVTVELPPVTEDAGQDGTRLDVDLILPMGSLFRLQVAQVQLTS